MSRRTSLILGAEGQDGRLLGEVLTARGDRVVPVGRPHAPGAVDITRSGDVDRLVAESEPDEIYVLAALHHASQDRALDDAELTWRSYQVNTLPVTHLLRAMATHRPEARLFYAASSHVFGTPRQVPQSEDTPLDPSSTYGITKAAGLLHCRSARRRGLFASVGILYTHESPLRSERFVTRKICKAAAQIQRGEREQLVLGDLSAEGDFGWAADHVDAMVRILAADSPEDFVVATGQRTSVGQLAQRAFAMLGLRADDHVVEDPSLLRRRSPLLVGDATRLRQRTGWAPTVDVNGILRALLRADGARLVGDG
ncbi:MAG: GDP-mannose 4,6-dehydratase [Myxococcales bacterium]|nr:GDP-mannose 4,6-dehydratase [Myxococcales bacterium]